MFNFFQILIVAMGVASILTLAIGGILWLMIRTTQPTCERCRNRNWRPKMWGWVCRSCSIFIDNTEWNRLAGKKKTCN
jgi:hypothetical protein